MSIRVLSSTTTPLSLPEVAGGESGNAMNLQEDASDDFILSIFNVFDLLGDDLSLTIFGRTSLTTSSS